MTSWILLLLMIEPFVIFRCISTFIRQNKTDHKLKIGSIYTSQRDQMNVPIEQKEKLKREIKIKKETDKVEFEFALIKSSILMFCDGLAYSWYPLFLLT